MIWDSEGVCETAWCGIHSVNNPLLQAATIALCIPWLTHPLHPLAPPGGVLYILWFEIEAVQSRVIRGTLA